uniref:Cytochrome c oxidase subunit 1 n=1 Tax=Strombidium cf. sulcatum TaxID=2793073 RepID=A0A7T0Q5S6_9SPIT|nr:cytochrome c oxidase subunit 1 [Strombidium cf. sulcatum]QPL15967.1 cytochrome c oxidase subunit 1 [Strombidium cf. sulcatum]
MFYFSNLYRGLRTFYMSFLINTNLNSNSNYSNKSNSWWSNLSKSVDYNNNTKFFTSALDLTSILVFVFKSIFRIFWWFKLRLSYLTHNWIYTTNHKRIGINYFNFILVAGTAGMGLATVIRAEFAYPGLGIMLGDSAQYLLVTTGHGVIMVFYMIMPSSAGAFGNFLLPTQLGVHDVAFPRLNSAAFWFLPGGLLMLCHLVCTDRKYKRLNPFNIRELTGMLRRDYVTDLINTNEHHELLNPTMTSLKFKLNSNSITEQNISLFYKYGITSSPKNKNLSFSSPYPSTEEALNTSSIDFLLLNNFNGLFQSSNFLTIIFSNITSLFYSIVNSLSSSFTFVKSSYTSSVNFNVSYLFSSTNYLLTYFNSLVQGLLAYPSNSTNSLSSLDLVSLYSSFVKPLTYLFNTNYFNLNILFSTLLDLENLLNSFKNSIEVNFMINLDLSFLNYVNNYSIFSSVNTTTNLTFSSENITQTNEFTQINSNYFELSNSFRYVKYHNPTTRIYYKSGYYAGLWETRYPMQFTTLNEMNRIAGTRTPNWMFTKDYVSSVTKLFDNFKTKFQMTNNFSSIATTKNLSTNPRLVLPIDIFFNFSYILSNSFYSIQNRWISINSLDQKFYRMFNTNSTQRRIFSKWRELKFTREAWRCKLLAARNQNAFLHRFENQEGLMWTMLRNYRDTIPGWAMITPFTTRVKYTAYGKVDIGCFAVWIALNASIISSANFLITYRYLSTLNNRKLRDARAFFAESLLVSSWMMIAANPMLAIALLMIISDRHWNTCFFDYSGGGDSVMFQHMFWFFGHPEVYIVMIPIFGFANTIFSYYFRKRISARASLLYSMYTIAFLGFWVWGHHMYMVGLSHTTRMLFSTLTVMISVPASTKLMHWCVTIVNSAFNVELPLVFSFCFAFFFTTGGISGMSVAHVGMDVLFHDTFYVIGHFHIMFAGAAMYGIFAAFYFYFPALYGVKYSRIYGYIHFVYYLLGQILTVGPMIWLGYWGMPRRIFDYPRALGGWHSLASAGHMLSVTAMVSFFIMIYDSIRQSKPAIRNTFGPARFNTRLNFYLYEGNRVSYVQRRSFFMYRKPVSFLNSKKQIDYLRLALIETTLFSYSFHQK